MSGLKLRKAEVSDVDTIVSMRLSLQRHLEKSNPLIWRYTDEKKKLIGKNLEELLADENHLILIAEVDKEVVGFIHGQVQQRLTHLPTVIGSLATVFVNEGFRRRGIGSRLINEIYKFFRTKKVEDVYLRYVVGNREGVKFWETLGFEPILVTAHSEMDS